MDLKAGFTLVAFALALGAPLASAGQQEQPPAETKVVRHSPIRPTSAADGKEMFNSYCAVCHGKDAKGNGPAAAELKQVPANLTTLAQTHGGKFPADRVAYVLRSGAGAPAHGTSEMPIWGPLFSKVSGSDPGIVDLRISNLIRYIESLQVK